MVTQSDLDYYTKREMQATKKLIAENKKQLVEFQKFLKKMNTAITKAQKINITSTNSSRLSKIASRDHSKLVKAIHQFKIKFKK